MKLPCLIANLSGAYVEEDFPGALNGIGAVFHSLDLRSVSGTFCYCDTGAAESIKMALSPWLGKSGIHWIDSGDYHYISLFFCEAVREPFTLVLLDNHSDDMEPEFPGVLSCGSWVREAREKCPFLKEVITIGPEGNRPFLGKIEGKVYLSVDKDIMSTEWSRTAWSQGSFSLDEVKGIISEIVAISDGILGIDVCGELSRSHGASDDDLETNLRTNMSLMRFFAQL